MKDDIETVKKSYLVGHKDGDDIYLNLAIDKKKNKTYVSEESLEYIKEYGLSLSIKLPGKSEQEHEYLEFINGKLLIVDKGPGKENESLIGGKEQLNANANSPDNEMNLTQREPLKNNELVVSTQKIKERSFSFENALEAIKGDVTEKISKSSPLYPYSEYIGKHDVPVSNIISPSSTPIPPPPRGKGRGNNGNSFSVPG